MVTEILQDSRLHELTGYHQFLETKQTLSGTGVFAMKDISAGTILLAFEQSFVSQPTTITLRVDENVHQLATDLTAFENFINHSCDPTAMIDWDSLTLVAKRDIVTGQQITYDYVTSDWGGEDPFECSCGAYNCRKSINGVQSLSIEEQRRIIQFVSPYIRKKLNMHQWQSGLSL